jgi:hypothetical protein
MYHLHDFANLGPAPAEVIHRETGDAGPLDGARADRRSGAGVLRNLGDARRISSVAAATVCRLRVTCSAAAATTLACAEVSSAPTPI